MSHAFDSSVGKASDKTTEGGSNNWSGQDLWNMSDWRQAFSQSGSTASDCLPSLGLSGNADGRTATGSLSKLENDFRTLLNDVRDFEKQSGMSPQSQSGDGHKPSDGRHHGGRKRHGGHGHGHCHSDGSSNEGDGTTGPTGSASAPGDGASNSKDGSTGPTGGAAGPGDGASNSKDGTTGPTDGTAAPGDGASNSADGSSGPTGGTAILEK